MVYNTDMDKNHVTLGILAHVDAGKTTLSESLLLNTNVIRSAGRVDNGTSFLDRDPLERSRGITIYSKNARIPIGDNEVILIDTPGHADLAAECERILPVIDMALLLVSAPDGVRPYTKTLWDLLRKEHIPTMIFVNKTDLTEKTQSVMIKDLEKHFGSGIISFSDKDFFENAASTDEVLMDKYLDAGLDARDIRCAFNSCTIYPLFFGSALRGEGISEFISALENYILPPAYLPPKGGDFSGIVYKISHTPDNKRLSFMRVTCGTLKVKDVLGEEKVNEIRIYSGEKYTTAGSVTEGDICALVGMKSTHAGSVFGDCSGRPRTVFAPALSYAVRYPADVDKTKMLNILREIEDEETTLAVRYYEQTGEIFISLMGDIQTDVIKHTLKKRYGIDVTFDNGVVCYKETIDMKTVGVGHYEPLKHYAEVQILMEPLERGMGMEYSSDVSEDDLDKNWQRLILTHMQERDHPGVLLGAPITDIRLTLVAGRSHIKHTEGGDFRQATYRAIRQGLMKLREAGYVHILEPYYNYTLKLPENCVGQAMTEISAMSGVTEIVNTDPTELVVTLSGRAPVSEMNDYASKVRTYTKGQGELTLSLAGYDLCHDEEAVLAASEYSPESDPGNPTGSVFCSHGAGTTIPWNEVDDHKHIK
ncbi:MAG: TetM/TetW/TetO/TetS family tetracycline resistance ribosomal protection protein [Lachnospiraceae bacterium]|nr:TetM/TetW/TetO/TetS family tetracycline resistance ribosomal protection protein [Lachnospiraceae bacterium]